MITCLPLAVTDHILAHLTLRLYVSRHAAINKALRTHPFPHLDQTWIEMVEWRLQLLGAGQHTNDAGKWFALLVLGPFSCPFSSG
jgi:hypothetical protein